MDILGEGLFISLHKEFGKPLSLYFLANIWVMQKQQQQKINLRTIKNMGYLGAKNGTD